MNAQLLQRVRTVRLLTTHLVEATALFLRTRSELVSFHQAPERRRAALAAKYQALVDEARQLHTDLISLCARSASLAEGEFNVTVQVVDELERLHALGLASFGAVTGRAMDLDREAMTPRGGAVDNGGTLN